MRSRSPRALALWCGAVVVAVVTAVVVASDLAALHRHAHQLGPEQTVIVARHDLTLGTKVRAGDLRERRVHASQLPPRVLRSASAASGRVVRFPVLRDGFVSSRNLAPRHRRGLDGAIPEGMRAMRVVVGNSIRPRIGAAVDVIATYESTDAEASSSVIVADGVLVLGTDTTRSSEGAAALGVTLLVSAREAREVAYASAHGVLTLALVPPEEARGL
jgi:Flp pilus assembly protein CpaB